MTTAAMVFGVVPLITATGAGAVSRTDIGIGNFLGNANWNMLYIIYSANYLYLLGKKACSVIYVSL